MSSSGDFGTIYTESADPSASTSGTSSPTSAAALASSPPSEEARKWVTPERAARGWTPEFFDQYMNTPQGAMQVTPRSVQEYLGQTNPGYQDQYLDYLTPEEALAGMSNNFNAYMAANLAGTNYGDIYARQENDDSILTNILTTAAGEGLYPKSWEEAQRWGFNDDVWNDLAYDWSGNDDWEYAPNSEMIRQAAFYDAIENGNTEAYTPGSGWRQPKNGGWGGGLGGLAGQFIEGTIGSPERALLSGLAFFGAPQALGANLATATGLPMWAGKAVTGLGTGMLGNGGDLEGALKNYAFGQGTGMFADFAAPYVSSAVDSLGAGDWLAGAEAPLSSASEFVGDLPVDAGAGAGGMLFSPNSYMNQPGFLDAPDLDTALANSSSPVYADLADGVTYSAGSFTGYDPVTGTAQFAGTTPNPSELDTEDAENRDALEAGDDLSQDPNAPLTVTGADLQRYAKIAQTVDSMLGGSPDAPQRAEGQSDEQYVETLVEYMGLDSATMAEQGLTPGSPEYMQYIMEQSDAIIAQVLGDADVNTDDLAAQLRGKTEAELLQLQRALYVRGQMETMMGSGTYADPYSGIGEEVLGEGTFNPNVAAYQRGRARDVQTLAGLQGDEAMDFLNSLLTRQGDPFGMQAAQDARFEQAKLNEGDERRRRGLLGY